MCTSNLHYVQKLMCVVCFCSYRFLNKHNLLWKILLVLDNVCFYRIRATGFLEIPVLYHALDETWSVSTLQEWYKKGYFLLIKIVEKIVYIMLIVLRFYSLGHNWFSLVSVLLANVSTFSRLYATTFQLATSVI